MFTFMCLQVFKSKTSLCKDRGPSYFPVSMLERDGQHMGVVTKALEKEVPPSSMMRRVLFIACIEPADRHRYKVNVVLS